VELACDALQSLPDRDFMARGSALRVLGLTYRTDGDLETALILLRESDEMNRAAGDSHLAMTVLRDLARTELLHGDLQRAMATCQEALLLAEERPAARRRTTAGNRLHLRLVGPLLREQNDPKRRYITHVPALP
jgi:ATP/maltotriose-dependent transcriptional regulator MalT